MFSLFLQTTQFKNDGQLTPLELFLLCPFLFDFSFDEEQVQFKEALILLILSSIMVKKYI